jgi:hypothetical protein
VEWKVERLMKDTCDRDARPRRVRKGRKDTGVVPVQLTLKECSKPFKTIITNKYDYIFCASRKYTTMCICNSYCTKLEHEVHAWYFPTLHHSIPYMTL